MNPLAFSGQFHIVETAVSPSTNTELKEMARQGAPEGTVLLAHRQTAGRGRLGRSFFSPGGTGLYLSVLFRPGCSPEQAVTLTVTAAVAAVRAVKRVCKKELAVKWVNDLYLEDKKVCGILTEGATDPETGRLIYAVCGIGFNLAPPKTGFPPELAAIAGGLCETATPALRTSLAHAFLEELKSALSDPFSRTLEEYRSRSWLNGKAVYSPSGAFDGPAAVLGIDDRAGLILRLADGTVRTISAGEVSVRPYE